MPGIRCWRVPCTHAFLSNRHASCGLKVLQKPASASLFQRLAIVNLCAYILQNTCFPSPHSSENYGCLAVKMPLKADLQISFLVPFRAFCRYLVSFYLSIWFSTRDFFDAKNQFLTPKKPLFNGCFALLGHVFNGSKRLCLYHYNVFLCFSSRI